MGVKDRSGNYIKFFTYLVIIVLINVAGITLFYRVDLTKNKMYSICEASQQVVSTLSEPLTIKVFFSKNLPAPHNNTERYLRDLLEEYSNHANQYFNYSFYDVSANEGDISQEAKDNQEMAQNYGIHPIQIQLIEEDEVKFQKAYMGLVLIHGDIIERIPTITSTERLEYRLTTAIQKMNNKISALLALPEKVRVKLFLSSSLETVATYMGLAELPKLPQALEGAVEKVNLKNYGKLEFEYLDPAKDADLEKEVEEYDILTLKWQASPENKLEEGKGSIGLVMEYRDKKVNIPLIQVLRLPIIGTRYEMADMGDLEEIINENVESLIGINEDLGYLADHGTLTISDRPIADPRARGQMQPAAASNFNSLASQTYTIKDVNLKDGPIPDGLNCLVIARPTERFTDYELFQIDQFLMRGKNLALFLDTFNEVRPPGNRPPVYTPLNTGLEKLLEHYGISMKRSYTMDENCYKQETPASMGGGEQAIYFAPFIKNQFINKDVGIMSNIKALVVAMISPLEINTERIKENGLQSYRMFSSSEKSWEMSGRIDLNPMMIQPPPPDKQKSLPLAYMLEGEFPSYFAGKSIPEKESENDDAEITDKEQSADEEAGDDGSKIADKVKPAEEKAVTGLSNIEDEGEIIAKGKPGRIVLIASSAILRDSILDAEGYTTNSTLIMNILDYLNKREAIAFMRSKEHKFNPLKDTGAGTKTLIKSFNIAGLPILVALFGLLVWFLRHTRRRRIRMMFQK